MMISLSGTRALEKPRDARLQNRRRVAVGNHDRDLGPTVDAPGNARSAPRSNDPRGDAGVLSLSGEDARCRVDINCSPGVATMIEATRDAMQPSAESSDAEQRLPFGRIAEFVSEAARRRERRGPDHREPADVVVREHQLRRPVGLEPGRAPGSRWHQPIFVRVHHVGVWQVFECRGHLVQGVRRQHVARSENSHVLAANHAQRAVPRAGALRLRGEGYETNTRLAGQPAVRLGESPEVRRGRDENPFPLRIALTEQAPQAAFDEPQISIVDGADEREESATAG